ncbi:MAG: hypothetical protein O6947_03960 [Acidobacteria bacterium]|nr:hypothetical protein [Acidobacteriota bacterium]
MKIQSTEPRIRTRPGRDLTDILTQALRSGTPGILHVRGDSMVPTLREGTAVRIRPIPAGKIRVGRIAVFQKEDLIIIHRLIWKQNRDGVTLYLFKGDNGALIDHVPAERILGEVEGILREEPTRTAGSVRFKSMRWDPAYWFYRISYSILSLPLRSVGFLTGRPPRLPSGPVRTLLKRVHRIVEIGLFPGRFFR